MRTRAEMHPVHLIRFPTPKKAILYGYWVGATRPKRVIIWTHGLGSSMFSKYKIASLLARNGTAVLMYNNRGHDKVASLSVGKKYVRAGSSHEVFTDCVDDIQGAIKFAIRQGRPRLYLAGHSTGTQKTVYWAYKKRGLGVRGIILLGPISDYATNPKYYTKKKMRGAEKIARAYIRQGRKHELLPEKVWSWPWTADAQRFLSLYTGSGSEEIFTYWNRKRAPKAIRSIKLPTLVILAEKDEFADRPARKLVPWFEEHVKKGRVVVIPKVPHSFKGGEKTVAREIQRFMER